MQDADGAGDVDRAIEKEMVAAVVKEFLGDGGGRTVFAGRVEVAVLCQQFALGGCQVGFDEGCGEIGRWSNEQERREAGGEALGEEEGNPAAHRGADQQKRSAGGDGFDDQGGVRRPEADCAVQKIAAGGAVTGIVEPEHRLAGCGAGLLQDRGFGAGHVGGEAGQENDNRTVARVPLIGEFDAVRPSDGGYGQGEPP